MFAASEGKVDIQMLRFFALFQTVCMRRANKWQQTVRLCNLVVQNK